MRNNKPATAGSFKSGGRLEASIAFSNIFNQDKALQIMGYKINVNNKVTVIDSLIVYGNNILIVECKNVGFLSGDVLSPFWKIATVRGQIKRIFNPIKQNAFHKKLLILYLAEHKIPTESYTISDYIVVPDRCTIEVSDSLRPLVLKETEFDAIKARLSMSKEKTSPQLLEVLRK